MYFKITFLIPAKNSERLVTTGKEFCHVGRSYAQS